MTVAARYRPHTPEFRRVSIALFLAGLATFATIHCTQALLPLLADAFRVSPATATLSLSATTLALGVTLVFLGPISDAVGRTTLMHVSLFASAVLTIAVALAPGWGLLVAGRAVVGIAVAGLPAVAVAYLREEIDHAAASGSIGLYIGGTGLGGMSGRLLAGGVADLFGWRWGIASIGILGVACAVAVVALLPPSRHFVPAKLDHRDQFLLTVGVLTDPVLLGLYLVGFTSMGTLAATFNALGFRLAAPPYSLSVGVVSLMFLAYALGSVSSARAGWLADRHGPQVVLIVSFVVAIVGELLTLFGSLWLVIVGLAIMTIGFFASHGVASGWVAARADHRDLGKAQAASLYLFSYYLGASAMGAVGSAVWSVGGWGGVTALTVGLLAAGLLASVAMRSTRRT